MSDAYTVAHGVRLLGDALEPSTPNSSFDKASVDRPFSDWQISFRLERGSAPSSELAPVWSEESAYTGALFQLYKDKERAWLKIECEGRGTFEYDEDAIRVAWHAGGTSFEHYLYGLGLAVALEQRGVPCLHGSALVLDGRCFALLGDSQTGKSTLTLALMRAGASMLSDDFLPIYPIDGSWWVYPGTRSVRLWPDSFAHFAEDVHASAGPRVHARHSKRHLEVDAWNCDSNVPAPQVLERVYWLQAASPGSSVRSERLSPVDRAYALLQTSIGAMPAKALGLEEARFECLTQIASTVPFRRLVVPHTYTSLEALCDVIRSELEGESGEP